MSAGTCEACKGLTGELHRVVIWVDDSYSERTVCQRCVERLTAALRRWLW